MPMITSQSPVAPLISFDFRAGASIASKPFRFGYALASRAASPRRNPPNRGSGGRTRRSAAALGAAEVAVARNDLGQSPIRAQLLRAPIGRRVAIERAERIVGDRRLLIGAATGRNTHFAAFRQSDWNARRRERARQHGDVHNRHHAHAFPPLMTGTIVHSRGTWA